ncbi:MAG: HyaD/HybD family hydrogenase maturation endopeptidase [Hydrogenothermaceae bacterium]|nr:HyaD/HybD family hydrogenase maturation endopeptidase [Hydrogenothermaceae bacterium]
MKIVVLGVGNVLFKDEGFGVFVVKYLEKNYRFKPVINLVDGGTGGFKLIEYFQDYDYVILVDTISVKDKAGTVYRVEGEKLAGISSYHQTAHEVEILQIIDLAALSGKSAKTIVIGIVPEDINSSQIGLTEQLEKSFPFAVNQVINELTNLGVNCEKINEIPLKEVVLDFIGSYNDTRRY